jgi:uncharacterized membrane protein HdeD (DUF308 family)
MQQLMNNYRTMFLFRGLAAIIFGILTLVWPRLSLAVLVFMFGIFAVINGITAIVAALRNREEPHWGLLLFEGILGVLAGAVALVWPGITALAFLFLIAAWAILTGVMELVAPLAFPMSGGRVVLMVLAGLASIVFGVLIAAQPASGLLAVVWLIGIYAIVFGVMHLAVYFEARSWFRVWLDNIIEKRSAHEPSSCSVARGRRVEEGMCNGGRKRTGTAA